MSKYFVLLKNEKLSSCNEESKYQRNESDLSVYSLGIHRLEMGDNVFVLSVSYYVFLLIIAFELWLMISSNFAGTFNYLCSF